MERRRLSRLQRQELLSARAGAGADEDRRAGQGRRAERHQRQRALLDPGAEHIYGAMERGDGVGKGDRGAATVGLVGEGEAGDSAMEARKSLRGRRQQHLLHDVTNSAAPISTALKLTEEPPNSESSIPLAELGIQERRDVRRARQTTTGFLEATLKQPRRDPLRW